MWIPESEAEILAVLSAGSLEETSIFDAKRELPDPKNPKKNSEIAKDIAAMANDGGVIIYGIEEDKNTKQPTKSHPIPLTHVRERINSIVRTSISEPPLIKVLSIPTSADPTMGYVVVIVPTSSRAPHMVVVKDEHRYYGRNSAGNMILAEGEVSRLYERRRKFEEQGEALLDELIQASPFNASNDSLMPFQEPPKIGVLYLTAKPLMNKENILEQAAQNNGEAPDVFLNRICTIEGYTQWVRSSGGFKLDTRPNIEEPERYIDLTVKFDGSVTLICGGAAFQDRRTSTFFINDVLIFELTKRFLVSVAELYKAAQYIGPVDIGIAITGIKGGTSLKEKALVELWNDPMGYDQSEYRKTTQVSGLIMHDNKAEILAILLKTFIRDLTRHQHEEFKFD